MRDTDKFCANCGAAVAPRPARKQPAADTPAEQAPAPRAPRSTVEAFQSPLPMSPQPSPQASSQPSSQPRVVRPPEPRVSPQEEQQVLLEAEEIAAVRGKAPIEVLPEIVPPRQRPAPPQPAATQICGACGRQNPAENHFCEGCGRALQAGPGLSAPAPITQTSWLDDNQRAAAPAPVAAVPVAPSAPAPVPNGAQAKTQEDFFYFYDDKAAHRGNRPLLFALVAVLVLGIGGVLYLMLRPSTKTAPGGNVTVSLSPTEAKIAPGGTQDFAATVAGSGDSDVTWSVEEGNVGGSVVNRGAQAQGGSVATMAIYAAPTKAGTYHVVATSKADPTKSATAEVTVEK